MLWVATLAGVSHINMNSMNIHLSNNYILVVPDDYEKMPLSGLNAWVAELRTRSDRGVGALMSLCHGASFCCLGVLSQTQGRLTPSGRDGHESGDPEGLARDNPLFYTLGDVGMLPPGVHVEAEGKRTALLLTEINDRMETGPGWEIIPAVLEQLYYDP
jgi:hypothetical protein